MSVIRSHFSIPSLCLALLLALAGCGGGPSADEAPADASGPEERSARTQVERGPVKITVEVDPKKARLSDEPILTVTVEAAPGIEVEMPPFGESLGAFLVRDFREPLPEESSEGQILKQIYTLEPTETGELSIYPIPFTFKDNRPEGDGKEHSVETEGLTVEIASPLAGSAPDLAELNPPEGPKELPAAPMSLAWYIVGAALVILAALILVSRKRKKEEAALEKKLSPKELAYLELQELLELNLIERDIKLFYVELTGIVRRYIERTTGIRAPEQTTEEFLHEIGRKPVFSDEESGRLQRFLEAADLVKFAAFQPGRNEVENSFQRAKIFVGLEGEAAA
jgi:hypothetical protein